MTEVLRITPDSAWLSKAEAALPEASLRRVAICSLLTLLLGFGGLTAWAAIAKVESAVPASGFVVSGSKRKTISLADPGILHELLVHEGDKVVAGQVLLRLDKVQARATRDQSYVQYWSAVARAARLAAEAMDRRELPTATDLQAAANANSAVAAAVQAEAHQFKVRWDAFDASVRVQDRKIAQAQAQASALRAQIAASGIKLGLLQEELKNVNFLLLRGLETKPHQLDLLRTDADLRGTIGQLGGQLVQTEQSMAQTEQETLNNTETRRADISREQSETQATMADADQRLRAATDQLSRREINAPEAGTVTDLKFFTLGSSIMAGQPIMDLVPDTQQLLIEGTVAPNEVEHLAAGQRVNVRLTAYKAHRVPVITGHLTYVGADRQLDANNQPIFLIRAAIDPDALRDKPGITLLPGMPADVLIINGERSIFSFLISPITDSIRHAMREE